MRNRRCPSASGKRVLLPRYRELTELIEWTELIELVADPAGHLGRVGRSGLSSAERTDRVLRVLRSEQAAGPVAGSECVEVVVAALDVVRVALVQRLHETCEVEPVGISLPVHFAHYVPAFIHHIQFTQFFRLYISYIHQFFM